MIATKLLHRILTFDLWPWFLTYNVNWLQNATPSPFFIRFRFCLLYVIALGEDYKTSSRNFDFWPLWPLTLIFTYIVHSLQNATPSPFFIQFWFRLLYVIALLKVMATNLLHRILTFDLDFLPLTFDLDFLPLTFDLDFWPILLIGYKMLLLRHFHPISIPFALYDSTRWWLPNFFTEFWPLTFDLYC